MVASLDSTTVNFKLPLPRFDRRTWHEQFYAGMQIIDAVLQKYISVRNVQGVWGNATEYSIGQVVIDVDNGSLYECLIAHTSAATPSTFLQDRTAHPTYWKNATLAERNRGTWVTNTLYSVGDFVVSGNIYAICNTSHTSGATFAGDVSKWDYLIDFVANDVLKDYTASGSPFNITWSDGTHARVTNTSASDSQMTFIPRSLSSGRTQTMRLTVIQSSTGKLLFPASVRWSGGVAPTFDTTAGTRAEYIITTSDNGTTYDAFLIGVRMA